MLVNHVFSDSSHMIKSNNRSSESFSATQDTCTSDCVVLSSVIKASQYHLTSPSADNTKIAPRTSSHDEPSAIIESSRAHLQASLPMDSPVISRESLLCTVSTASFPKLSPMLVVSAIEYPVTMTSPAPTSRSTFASMIQFSDTTERSVEPRAENMCVPSLTEEHYSKITSNFPEISVPFIRGSALAALDRGSAIQEQCAEFVDLALPTVERLSKERSLTMELTSLSLNKVQALDTTINTAIREPAVNGVQTMDTPSLMKEKAIDESLVTLQPAMLSENESPLSVSIIETSEDVIDYTGM